jgi:hypothetical protein
MIQRIHVQMVHVTLQEHVGDLFVEIVLMIVQRDGMDADGNHGML